MELLIKQAKVAQAGIDLMMQIIGQINTRRPDLVEDAAEKVIGVKSTVGDDVFNAAMMERVEAVTTFDPIAARIAELEAALQEMHDTFDATHGGDGVVQRAYEVLK